MKIHEYHTYVQYRDQKFKWPTSAQDLMDYYSALDYTDSLGLYFQGELVGIVSVGSQKSSINDAVIELNRIYDSFVKTVA